MKKALLLSLVLISNMALAETKVNFSGDAYVKGYFKNSTGKTGDQAFNQMFRLNLDAQADENLSLKAGLILSGNTWEGDNHTTNAVGGTHEDGVGGGDTTRLDTASLHYLKNGWLFSAGRMAITSPGSFLTSDDRRDRLQLIKFVENGMWAFVYDKRKEGTIANGYDDANMYSINFYGKTESFNYALQTGYFTSKNVNANYLKDTKQFTPQIDGKMLGLDYAAYYTLLYKGKPGTLYYGTHHSLALVLGKDFETFKVQLLSAHTQRGGLIASGFDTFSSVINNSPDHNQSSIRLGTIGLGLGTFQKNEHFTALKLTAPIGSDLVGSASFGRGNFYVTKVSALKNESVVDATLKYKLSKNLSLDSKYGRLLSQKVHGGSLALNAQF